MKIVIIGATGFIGKSLLRELEKARHTPVAISRNISRATAILGKNTVIREWNGKDPQRLAEILNDIETIINLAGENISSGRWTKKRRNILTESRVGIGNIISEAFQSLQIRPKVLIQASAIGFYGSQPDGDLTESDGPGKGFLADLVQDWENSVSAVSSPGTRVIYIRSGLILGNGGGVLPRLLFPYRFFAGGPLGNGRQWVSWIHLADHISAIRFLAEHPSVEGPVNLTSPHPVQMNDLSKSLAKVFGRPGWFRVPAWILKAVYGEMAEQTVLSGQRVLPEKLVNAGFDFRFGSLESALNDLLKS
jgi:uncharacterized protein (TIGR01777 family)